MSITSADLGVNLIWEDEERNMICHNLDHKIAHHGDHNRPFLVVGIVRQRRSSSLMAVEVAIAADVRLSDRFLSLPRCLSFLGSKITHQ
ncbi:hypothetical protein L2E82_10451 [Cichorium intybus]|uniref:Uncharacterized protein n=1 Tax=Cichorium intybus TaxID=13427 RepID=A0ACB9GBQ1_CICIN|nr:hypothetical protein L2E82_10451 [Cichorium intybus]